MKHLLALFAFLLAFPAFAADHPISCSGANCKVTIQARDGSGVATNAITATATGTTIKGSTTLGDATGTRQQAINTRTWFNGAYEIQQTMTQNVNVTVFTMADHSQVRLAAYDRTTGGFYVSEQWVCSKEVSSGVCSRLFTHNLNGQDPGITFSINGNNVQVKTTTASSNSMTVRVLEEVKMNF